MSGHSYYRLPRLIRCFAPASKPAGLSRSKPKASARTFLLIWHSNLHLTYGVRGLPYPPSHRHIATLYEVVS